MAQRVKKIYEFDEFRLDISERLLLRQNEPISLPEKAFEILRLLIENAGHLVEKHEILNTVWAGAFVEENNMDKNISILRRALGEKKGGKKYIETVRGHGYRFVAKVRRNKSDFETPRLGADAEPGKREGREKSLDDTPVLLSSAPQIPFASSRQTKRSGNVVALAQWRRDVEEVEEISENAASDKAAFDLIREIG